MVAPGCTGICGCSSSKAPPPPWTAPPAGAPPSGSTSRRTSPPSRAPHSPGAFVSMVLIPGASSSPARHRAVCVAPEPLGFRPSPNQLRFHDTTSTPSGKWPRDAPGFPDPHPRALPGLISPNRGFAPSHRDARSRERARRGWSNSRADQPRLLDEQIEEASPRGFPPQGPGRSKTGTLRLRARAQQA